MKKFRACKIQHFADGREKKKTPHDAAASPRGSPCRVCVIPTRTNPRGRSASRYCIGEGGRRNAGGEGRDFNLSNSNDPSIGAQHRISALQTVSRFLPWIWSEIFPCRSSSGRTARRGTHASRCIPCSPHGPMAAAAAAGPSPRCNPAANPAQSGSGPAALSSAPGCSRSASHEKERGHCSSEQGRVRLLNAGRQLLSAAPLPAATRPALLQCHPDALSESDAAKCRNPIAAPGGCLGVRITPAARAPSPPGLSSPTGRAGWRVPKRCRGCPYEGAVGRAVRAAAALLLQTEPCMHSTSRRTLMFLRCTPCPPHRSEEAKR